MSAQPIPVPPPFRGIKTEAVASPPSSFWDRATTWASENKALVYTIAGVAVVVTGAGAVYYFNESSKARDHAAKRVSKKERRRAKKEKEATEKSIIAEVVPETSQPTMELVQEDAIPAVDEATVHTMYTEQERKDMAGKLKVAGNKAYGEKRYDDAIDLYGKAIICKPDAVFYSNRAACYSAKSEWQKVVEDTTAAINLDNEYVKALNRRANAYEALEMHSEALLDYTASCIIDSFRNENSAQAVERLLKTVAEKKALAIIESKKNKLPSATFITNYIQSFRAKPPPAGLEESADLDEQTGKGQLQAAIKAMNSKTAEGYTKAAESFTKALELGDVGDYEAFAYNMRGTFRYLQGQNQEALEDLSMSIELDPAYTQSYIKRASMYLEQGSRELATKDFELAEESNKDDPDIYYHRAQLAFILGETSEAAKDYQKSIDLDKDFIFSHIQLGVTQYKMGSIASSMATFRRTIKAFSDVPDVYNYYGELLLDQQKYQEAIEKFDTAIEKEKQSKPLAMNVLPLINKGLALFQWKQDFAEAEKLCEKALIIDPECDIAVATKAQLLLQQGKIVEALEYFERAAELSRTLQEVVSALSYAEATRTQLEVQSKYPQLASRLQGMGAPMGAMG